MAIPGDPISGIFWSIQESNRQREQGIGLYDPRVQSALNYQSSRRTPSNTVDVLGAIFSNPIGFLKVIFGHALSESVDQPEESSEQGAGSAQNGQNTDSSSEAQSRRFPTTDEEIERITEEGQRKAEEATAGQGDASEDMDRGREATERAERLSESQTADNLMDAILTVLRNRLK